MRTAICSVGVIASLVMLICTCAMNWNFGYSLGKNQIDSTIYGGVSVATDVFLAFGVIFVLWSLEAKKYGRSIAGTFLVFIFAGYSLTSAAGYTAASRSALVTTESNKTVVFNNNAMMMKGDTARLNAIDKELSQLSEKLSKKGYLTGKQKKRREELTAERKQLKIDIRQYKLDIGLDTIVITQANTVSSQNAFFSKVLGIDKENVGAFLTGILSLVLLFGSSLGFYVSMGALLDRKQEPKQVPVPTSIPAEELTLPATPEEVEDTPSRLGTKLVEEDNVIHFERLEKPQKKKKKANAFQTNQDLVREFLEGCKEREFRPSQGWEMFKEQYPHMLKENQFYAAMKALANRKEIRRKKVGGATVYEVSKAA